MTLAVSFRCLNPDATSRDSTISLSRRGCSTIKTRRRRLWISSIVIEEPSILMSSWTLRTAHSYPRSTQLRIRTSRSWRPVINQESQTRVFSAVQAQPTSNLVNCMTLTSLWFQVASMICSPTQSHIVSSISTKGTSTTMYLLEHRIALKAQSKAGTS